MARNTLTVEMNPARPNSVCFACGADAAGLPFRLTLKTATSMGALFENFAQSQRVPASTLCFVFDRDLIPADLTVADLELAVGDQIVIVGGGTGDFKQDAERIAVEFKSSEVFDVESSEVLVDMATALMGAICACNVRRVIKLLKSGADPTSLGRTAAS